MIIIAMLSKEVKIEEHQKLMRLGMIMMMSKRLTKLNLKRKQIKYKKRKNL